VSPRGFTLLEILVALAIVAVLAGAAVTGGLAMRESVRADATAAHLERVASAVHRFAADAASENDGVDALPPDLTHLYANPSGVAGWRGPYVLDRRSPLGLASGPPVDADAWGRPIAYERIGLAPGAAAGDESRARLASAGPDGVSGNGDDLVFELDVAAELRAETLRRLERIRVAILAYHEAHLYGALVSPTDVEPPAGTGALPPDWATARAILVATGYLPDEDRYRRDAWGDDFVADGYVPLWRVVSLRSNPILGPG
jgi:prepilin-type N-terminal cleavage/methylation domain-containing protein